MNVIEFPYLFHLKFEISRVAFKLFGLPIYWYGIILSLAFLTAVLLAMRNSSKFGIDSNTIIDLVLFATPVAIIFARLYYVIFRWEDFKGNLLDIFNTRMGGLAIYGGLIGALLTAWIFARIKKIKAFKLLDFCLPYFVLAQSIGRWGNFVNQEAYGTNTTLPWGMTGNTINEDLWQMEQQGYHVNASLPVHPTFLYESLWNLAVFAFLVWYRKRKKLDGEVFSLYMICYGAGRFFIEGLRLDSLYVGGFRISQVLSLLFVIGFGIWFIVRRLILRNSLKKQNEAVTSEYTAVLESMMYKENDSNTAVSNEKTQDTGMKPEESAGAEPD